MNFFRISLCFIIILFESPTKITCSAEYPPLFESLLTYLKNSIEWDSNHTKDRVNVLPEYDFIVVGAGSAGSVVASRLSEVTKWKILLLEAGQDALNVMNIPLIAPGLQVSDINWKYRTVSMNTSCLGFVDNRCKFPRGKVVGGSSLLNYMIYTRGNRKDYDSWAKMGNTGWSYDEVLKYFIKSENANLSNADAGYHGRDGLLSVTDVPYRTPIANAFVDAGSQIGLPVIDVNGEKQVGINYLQVTMKDGHRFSTNEAFLFPAKNRDNLHIKKYSMVTQILIDNNTKTAIGVEFVSKHKKFRVLARKEIVISGGTINSPQLLMLSGVGPRKHLKEKNIPLVKDLPVGENLMDHVALGSLNILINNTVSLKADKILNDPYSLHDYIINHRGVLTIPGGVEALAYLDVNHLGSTNGYPNLELLLVSGLYSSTELNRKYYGIKSDIYDKVYKPTSEMDGFIVFPMIMRPKSKGRIWLKNSNPFHYPLINPNYFAEESDLDVAVAGVRIVQKMLKTDAMKKLDAKILTTPLPGCVQHEFDSDEYWKCSARQISFTIYHLSGTCKMGPEDDPTAVVDPRLRVHGIKNLRVVDASIIPEIPAAHTNAPTIMIGEKGADMIKEDWGVKIWH